MQTSLGDDPNFLIRVRTRSDGPRASARDHYIKLEAYLVIRRSVLGEDLPFLFSLAVAAPTNTARAKSEPSH